MRDAWKGGSNVELSRGQVDPGVSTLQGVVGNAVFSAAKAFPPWVEAEETFDRDGGNAEASPVDVGSMIRNLRGSLRLFQL
jgi:hypothetical protein